jgi:hypothetical protein
LRIRGRALGLGNAVLSGEVPHLIGLRAGNSASIFLPALVLVVRQVISPEHLPFAIDQFGHDGQSQSAHLFDFSRRRGGRAVDCGGLENHPTLSRTVPARRVLSRSRLFLNCRTIAAVTSDHAPSLRVGCQFGCQFWREASCPLLYGLRSMHAVARPCYREAVRQETCTLLPDLTTANLSRRMTMADSLNSTTLSRRAAMASTVAAFSLLPGAAKAAQSGRQPRCGAVQARA